MDSSDGTDFTFSSDADFPNKVKLRKRIPFWWLEFTVGIDHDRFRHTLQPACIIKDKFLKGVFDIDVSARRLEYRKVCGIPCVGQLVLNAGLNYRNPFNTPRIGIHFSTSGPTAVVSGGCSTKFDQKLSLGKRVGLEFIGEIRRQGAAFSHDLGEGPLNVHLSEINAIIKL